MSMRASRIMASSSTCSCSRPACFSSNSGKKKAAWNAEGLGHRLDQAHLRVLRLAVAQFPDLGVGDLLAGGLLDQVGHLVVGVGTPAAGCARSISQFTLSASVRRTGVLSAPSAALLGITTPPWTALNIILYQTTPLLVSYSS